MQNQSPWEIEQRFIEQAKKEYPDAFVYPYHPPEILRQRIGILEPIDDLPLGYIKYSPLDFIVEEILEDDLVINVTGNNRQINTDENASGTVYADLVKVGISTLDAVKHLAEQLKISLTSISYAGIKDEMALTAQRLSFRNTSLEAVKSISDPRYVLHNIYEGKAVLHMGSLKGNRFTLLIRAEKPVDANRIEAKLANIKQNGIANYYGPQRFGSPRYLSHTFGQLLLAGRLQDLIHTYICQTSPFEQPFIVSLRDQARSVYPDWAAIKRVFSPLPHSFRYELAILERLINNPTGYAAALSAVSDQVNFWARSYSSFLSNLLLSDMVTGKREKVDQLPLLLSQDTSNDNLYLPLLTAHGTQDFRTHYSQLRFMRPLGRSPWLMTFVSPTIHSHQILPAGLAISFDLRTGAYATTFLDNLFNIVPFDPVPQWLKTDIYDTKEVLGTGSLKDIQTELGPTIQNLHQRN